VDYGGKGKNSQLHLREVSLGHEERKKPISLLCGKEGERESFVPGLNTLLKKSILGKALRGRLTIKRNSYESTKRGNIISLQS